MKKLFILISLIAICNILSAQDVEGFQIQHKFKTPNGFELNGIFVSVQLKSMTKITKDSGIIVTTNKIFENRDLAQLFPDSNLMIIKDILFQYFLQVILNQKL